MFEAEQGSRETVAEGWGDGGREARGIVGVK